MVNALSSLLCGGAASSLMGDIADQFCNDYCSILRLKIIIIFCAWHPLVSKTKFTEMKKNLIFRYDNSEGLTGELTLSGSPSRSVVEEEAAPGLRLHCSSQGGQDASFAGVTVDHHQVFRKLIHLLALAANRPSQEGWYKLKFKQLKCDFGSLSSYIDDQSFTSKWLIRHLGAGRFNATERWYFFGIIVYI